MTLTIEANATSHGTAFQVVVRAMSPELRVALYRQLVAKTARHGVNVPVTLPAGELANELRRHSINLINAGAMLHGSGQTQPLTLVSRDLQVIFHHSLVDHLLKNEEAARYVEKESLTRLYRLEKMLHSLVLAQIEEINPRSVYELCLNDAVSVTDIGVTMYQLYGSHRETLLGYELHREALRIIRYIIAPHNEEHAEVRAIFHRSSPSDTLIELNRKAMLR